jgi:hypothetical protein
MSVAKCIYEWFQDHFDTFGCYPMDWIDCKGRLYGWDECWAILDQHYPNVEWRQPL